MPSPLQTLHLRGTAPPSHASLVSLLSPDPEICTVYCRVDSFLAGAEALTQPSRGLPQRTLEVTRVADANRSQPSGSALTSVQFHPSGQLLLTAGLDRRLHFFQVRVPTPWSIWA